MNRAKLQRDHLRRQAQRVSLRLRRQAQWVSLHKNTSMQHEAVISSSAPCEGTKVKKKTKSSEIVMSRRNWSKAISVDSSEVNRSSSAVFVKKLGTKYCKEISYMKRTNQQKDCLRKKSSHTQTSMQYDAVILSSAQCEGTKLEKTRDNKIVLSKPLRYNPAPNDSSEVFKSRSFVVAPKSRNKYYQGRNPFAVPRSEVEMMALMSHKVLCTPIKITALDNIDSDDGINEVCSLPKSKRTCYKNFKYCFCLEADLVSRILKSKDSSSESYDIQVLLRFCLNDTSCIQDDSVPYCIVKVNNKIALLQVKDTNCSPVDITNLCNFTEGMDSEDFLDIELMPGLKKAYCLTMCVAEKLTIPDFVSSLMKNDVKDESITREMVKRTFESDVDIHCTSFKVSLICPLGQTRLITPCRGSYCSHIQCIDAFTLLKMNEERPTSEKKCYVCDKELGDIYIDGLFLKILSRVPQFIDAVEFRQDGSWVSEDGLYFSQFAGEKKTVPQFKEMRQPMVIKVEQPKVNDKVGASKRVKDVLKLMFNNKSEERKQNYSTKSCSKEDIPDINNALEQNFENRGSILKQNITKESCSREDLPDINNAGEKSLESHNCILTQNDSKDCCSKESVPDISNVLDQSFESHDRIMTPNDSKDHCSKESMPDINNVLEKSSESHGTSILKPNVLKESGSKEDMPDINNALEKTFKNHGRILTPNDPKECFSKEDMPDIDYALEQSSESNDNILKPHGLAESCSKDNMPDNNNTLLEVCVNGANEKNCDLDLVCAIGSKVILMSSQGKPLRMDMMYYWCNFCSFKSEKKATLLQHVLGHRFHCKYCKFHSFSRAAVIHHCMEEHHDIFSETASIMKYCTYLPDLLKKNDIRKRKNGLTNDGPGAKRACVDDTVLLDMEVEEVESSEFPDSVSRPITPSVDLSENIKVSSNSSPVVTGSVVLSENIKVSSNSSPVVMGSVVLSENIKVSSNSSPVVTGSVVLSENIKVSSNSSPVVTGSVVLSENIKVSSNSSPVVTRSVVLSENIKVSSNSSPVVTETEKSLPVISNVISGQRAVTALLAKPKFSEKQLKSSLPAEHVTAFKSTRAVTAILTKPKLSQEQLNSSFPTAKPSASQSTPSPSVSLSSGFCWKCKYCDFVTTNQSLLKIHLKDKHPHKAHKYIVMPVYSEKNLTRLKLVSSKGLPLRLPAPESSAPLLNMPSIKKENAENDALNVEEIKEEKIIPISYKCAHCDCRYSEEEKVKFHLSEKHSGCVLYALDMKAVKLRQKCYIFFCHKKKCAFKTRETDDYLEHIDTCTPSSDGNVRKDVYAGVVKLLELINTFNEKTESGTSFGRDTKAIKSAEYACIYCSYSSNNNTRLKKHVFTNHRDKNCVIIDVPASKTNIMNLIYFCHFCLWETREDRELEIHTAECHGSVVQTTQLSTPAVALSLSNSQSQEKENAHSVRQDLEKKSKAQKRTHYVEEKPAERETLLPEAKEYNSDNGDDVKVMNTSYRTQTPSFLKTEKGRTASSATGEIYECLYCTTPLICFSRRDMKIHLLYEHAGDEFIYRDRIARKLCKPSRFYMCHNIKCDFTSQKQINYHLHMLGHKKAKIFECSKCQWFTTVSGDIKKHLDNGHTGKDATALEVDLDLDSTGNIMKLVNGTVIKF